MSDVVDARGYLCPHPIMMLVKHAKSTSDGKFDILVDNDESRENVCRTIIGRSWNVLGNVKEDDYYRISVSTDQTDVGATNG